MPRFFLRILDLQDLILAIKSDLSLEYCQKSCSQTSYSKSFETAQGNFKPNSAEQAYNIQIKLYQVIYMLG